MQLEKINLSQEKNPRSFIKNAYTKRINDSRDKEEAEGILSEFVDSKKIKNVFKYTYNSHLFSDVRNKVMNKNKSSNTKINKFFMNSSKQQQDSINTSINKCSPYNYNENNNVNYNDFISYQKLNNNEEYIGKNQF